MFLWLDKRSRMVNHEAEVPHYIPLEDAEEASGEAPEDRALQELSMGARKSLPRSHTLSRVTRRALGHLQVFVPSFLQSSPKGSKRLHPTAWLDGLRGIAALFVVFHHSSLLWFSWDIHKGWVPGEGLQLIKLPIIRLLISGFPHVAIFFAVSGFAISHKPLKLAREGRYDEVGSTLSSSVFRRHSRLFMPAAAVTLATALTTQLGWFDLGGLPGVAQPTRPPPHANNLGDQLLHFAHTEVAVTDPIGQEHAQAGVGRRVDNPYDANLWTLPIEFNSSMVVFMFLTAFARVHGRVRMAFALALIIYLQYFFAYWALFLFLGGMFICDLHLELEQRGSRPAEAPLPDEITVPPTWRRARQESASRITSKIAASRIPGRAFGMAAFVLALWLLSMPKEELGGREALGYSTITSLVSVKFHDQMIVPLGAVILVLVVDRATFLQVLFTNPFSQYMGRISFSLYMVHGPLLWTLGSVLGRKSVGITGGQTNAMYTLGIAIAAFLWWPVTIYVADLTYRCVDSKCVQFSRWAYESLLRKAI